MAETGMGDCEANCFQGTDAGALAKFFVATIQGMRAMARLKSDRRALRQVARIALAVFDR
jgi:hypothetical protein